MPNKAEAPFLSVAELARRLCVSRTTAYELVRDHDVPSIRFRGSIRVPAAALDQWLAERKAEALGAVRRGDEAA